MENPIRIVKDIECFEDLQIGSWVDFLRGTFIYAGLEINKSGSTSCGCAIIFDEHALIYYEKDQIRRLGVSEINPLIPRGISNCYIVDTITHEDGRYKHYKTLLDDANIK